MSVPPWRSGSSRKITAYTAVPTNQTLTRPPVPAASAPPPPSSSSSDNNDGKWPESLKNFITRCQEQGKNEDPKVLEAELRAVITKAFEEGTTWKIDWDSITLPLLDKKAKKRSIPDSKNSKNSSNSHTNSRAFQLKESEEKRRKRQRRFESSNNTSNSVTPTPAPATPDINEPLVGRSTKLEKRYLRLTSAPDPETVRPLHILQQTLELLKQKWRQEQNYAYICDQFKSLRQDLTVQHIQNEFTVSVYEIHARIALEKGDLGEYNQCQSQLNYLYQQGLPGNRKEFLAYRILYLCHTQNHAEIGHLLLGINEEQETRNHKAVDHALKVYAAMVSRNYHKLFKLYANAPNMGGYVMDCFLTRERLYALCTMCRTYRPQVSINLIAKELGFIDEDSDSDHQVDTAECIEFLNHYITVDPTKQKTLDTKECFVVFDQARLQAYKKVDIKGQL